MIRSEMQQRYGDSAEIVYINASPEKPRTKEQESFIRQIHERDLVYPVTVVDGAPLCDGAVSYPAILRAVENRLAAVKETE